MARDLNPDSFQSDPMLVAGELNPGFFGLFEPRHNYFSFYILSPASCLAVSLSPVSYLLTHNSFARATH